MITIIGAGKVGGDAAMFCALRSLGDVLLLDIVDGLPRGEAMDINQMLSERGIDSDVRGSTVQMKNSDIVDRMDLQENLEMRCRKQHYAPDYQIFSLLKPEALYVA